MYTVSSSVGQSLTPNTSYPCMLVCLSDSGSRVHIGQVLSHLRRVLPSFRTTSGKDYAIIWLHAVETDDVQPSHPSGDKGLGKYGSFTKYVQELLETRMKARPAASKDRHGRPDRQQQELLSVSSIATAGKLQQLFEQTYLARPTLSKQPPPQQQQQKQLTPPASAPPVPASPKAAADVSTDPEQAEPSWQPPLMAVYRSGSVVFMGMEDRAEHTRLMWLNRLVPLAVRYTREERSPWMRQGGPAVVCSACMCQSYYVIHARIG